MRSSFVPLLRCSDSRMGVPLQAVSHRLRVLSRAFQLLAVAVVSISLSACTEGQGPAPVRVMTSSAAHPTVSKECQPVSSGALPAWTSGAHPPADVPFVISQEQNVVGILFGYPLRSSTIASTRKNKVLWIVKEPRFGSPLTISGENVNGAGAVEIEQPADSDPGEIYPTIVDVPNPGCWEFHLSWNGNRGTVKLQYG